MSLPEHNCCTGCSACASICPRKAIVMQPDVEGFLYPRIDSTLCTKCSLCEKACPVIHATKRREPVAVYAAKAKNDDLRKASSSGGVFSLLAESVIKGGGVVFGAAFDVKDWQVKHCSARTKDELPMLRGSKYVQSIINNTYQNVGDALARGREVLFSGTPCQVAGLQAFLSQSGKVRAERLLCVEVICHAVPSPLVWRKYLEARVVTAYKDKVAGLVQIRRIFSRCKNFGWKRYAMSLDFANDMAYLACFDQDSFLRGFLAELYNRPSCHKCPCRNLSSGADITIGDYWGVDEKIQGIDDDLGISLVIASTAKGVDIFDRIKDAVDTWGSNWADAILSNGALIRSSAKHPSRDRFFHKITHCEDFDGLVDACLKTSLIRRGVSFVKRHLGYKNK